MMERPPSEKQRFTSNVIPTLVAVTDFACLTVSAPIALAIYAVTFGQTIDQKVHLAAAVIAAVAFFLIRQSHGSYSNPLVHLRSADREVAVDYGIAALLSSAVIWQFGSVGMFSRSLMLMYVGLTIGTLFVSRFFLKGALVRLADSGRLRQRVILYGSDPATLERTCRMLDLQDLPQLRIVGVADDRGERCEVADVPFIGGFTELVALARAGQIDQVLIALSDINRERLAEIMEELSAVSVDVSLIPREAILLAPDYRITFLGTVPVLTLWQRPMRDINQFVKRAEDLAVAMLALLFLSPLLLVTAILVKATSRGPILFVQPRFGFNNAEIMVYKFRSMYVDRQDVTGAERTQRNDARITPVGRVIRKLSIDELPQLWNVLKGDMSIVGPRPHATHMKVGDLYYFDAVKGYAARHRVKPGITGLAQVRGLRGEIATIERAKRRVELDTFYIDNWTLGLDIQIIFETMISVAYDKHAY